MIKPSLTALICVLNSKYIHSSLAPWCLLAGVNKYCGTGIAAEVTEGTINENIEDVAQRIVGKTPQVVGFCCYIWNITATIQLVNLVKNQLPDTIVVLGGPEVSYHAEEVITENPLIDYIISGEGEQPFAYFLDVLYAGIEPQNISGLYYRKDGQIITTPPHIPNEEPPSPYTAKYFDALKGRIAYLETSRGCPFFCAFCLSGRCGGVRYFDLERVKNELLLLANSGTQTVKLVDRTFNANRKRAVELFRFIIQNYGTAIPNGICFHFEIAGDLLDEETMILLATAPVGAIQLEIGLQSFNAQTLDAIHRKTDVKRLEANIRRVTASANMHIHIDLIAGLPLENWDSFAKSFNTAYSLKPNMLQLGFLKLLYGSTMREHPNKFPCRFNPQPPYEVIETPWISAQELMRLHHIEDALERLYNSGRFGRTLEYMLRQSEITPFELFDRFGEFSAARGMEKISLDNYTCLVFEYFSGMSGIDKAVLRDAMVCDRLSTNSSGRLPAVLEIKDTVMKEVRKELKRNQTTCPKRGVKRGAALLYSENSVVYVDYQNRNPITGEYPLFKLQLEQLGL